MPRDWPKSLVVCWNSTHGQMKRLSEGNIASEQSRCIKMYLNPSIYSVLLHSLAHFIYVLSCICSTKSADIQKVVSVFHGTGLLFL